ncbi:hypothetical protein XP4B_22040, partial [Xanthomonas perforans]
MPGRP